MSENIAEIAAKLTKTQRAYVTYYQPGEKMMGGYAADCGCPGLIERVGIHHPIFGSNHRLTAQGTAVRAHLLARENGGAK